MMLDLNNTFNATFPIENQIQFKTIFRQTDPKYIKILNNIRVGKITKSTITLLTVRDLEQSPVVI